MGNVTLDARVCADCGAEFRQGRGRGAPRKKCYDCSPKRDWSKYKTPAPDRIIECANCRVRFRAVNGSQKFCSSECRDSARKTPCSECGSLRWVNRTSDMPMICLDCRRRAPSGHGVRGYAGGCRCEWCQAAWDRTEHGTGQKYRMRCRCAECVAFKTAESRSSQVRTGYYERPEVQARYREWRSAYRLTPRGRASRRLSNLRRWARIRDAGEVPFTADQLGQRLLMFGGRCWICSAPHGDDFHWDHVKPVAAGGAHMLSNLRPACGPCNMSKGSQWPFEVPA